MGLDVFCGLLEGDDGGVLLVEGAGFLGEGLDAGVPLLAVPLHGCDLLGGRGHVCVGWIVWIVSDFRCLYSAGTAGRGVSIFREFLGLDCDLKLDSRTRSARVRAYGSRGSRTFEAL